MERSLFTFTEVTSEAITCMYCNKFGKHFIFYFKASDQIAVLIDSITTENSIDFSDPALNLCCRK